GLYTSPHLIEPAERIQIDGQPVTTEQFAGAFQQVHDAAAHMDSPPTYFETVTAMAFLLFRELGAERVVLETGLGGRLDATNVVAPELCVITPIDFDHEAWLGSGIESIAREKAGILKPGAPAVFASQRPEAAEVLQSRARELGIDFHFADGRYIRDLEMDARGCRLRIGDARVTCPLAGGHQVDNAVTAVTALERLGVPVPSIELGIARTVWPARLQLVSEDPEIIVDGAHNPAGIRALAAYIKRFYAGRRIWIVYGAMRDKSLGEIAGILSEVAGEIVLTAPKGPRAARPEALRELFDHPRVRLAPRLSQALEIAAEAGREDVVFVTGSLFLAGEFLALRQASAVEPPG
ncbi:MAG: bifunctional folylpolyglutamate synthase/dihydrofolate synthase, partial [Bryobacteraceae bacterium]